MIPNPASTSENPPLVQTPMWKYKLTPEDLTLVKLALANLHLAKKNKALLSLDDARKRLLKKMEKRDFFMILYFEPKTEEQKQEEKEREEKEKKNAEDKNSDLS